MKRRISRGMTWMGLALAAGAVGVALVAEDSVANDREKPPADAGSVVIVELFTSQGCSSCPPADRLLKKLAAEGDVFPLSFHVDYWNYIGWTDPFSSAEWSDRQRRYARAFGSGRVYTPQVVVDGAAECVGSNERRVRAEIADAAPADGRLDVVREPSPPGELRLSIDATVLGRGQDGATWDVLVAVVERGLVTPVGRGENSGRTLENDNVVRVLERAFELPARPGEKRSGTIEIALSDDWRRDHLAVAAFLQDRQTLRIHGAARLAMP